jgi:predicted DNA-binding transcriptional regulator AlpA
MSQSKKLVAPQVLARELGIPVATLWRWTLDGIIPRPVFQNNRVMGWERQVIDQWLEQLAHFFQKRGYH